MSSSADTRAWSRQRWWLVVTLVFVGQLGLIFWLGNEGPAPPRPIGPSPVLRLADEASTELLALEDPTLFALPHRVSFSGRGWMNPTSLPSPSFEWSEAPRYLSLPAKRLGLGFDDALESHRWVGVQPPAMPAPEVLPADIPPPTGLPDHSMLRLSQSLAARRLVSHIDLPSWTNADLLTNSVVGVMVDAQGRTFPGVLLSSSGATPADTCALKEAGRARFAPLKNSGPQASDPLKGLTWGVLIFEWHTLPPRRTK
jgi:hypothetical protein